jgi:hypothetical protein
MGAMKQAWLKATLERLPYGLVPHILLVGIPMANIL